MNFLSVENISKSFNEKPLFDGLSFGLSQGQKVALLGKNGCGKSTLLKIIAGLETPDEGQVVIRKGIVFGYLPQIPLFVPGQTIKEAVFDMDNEVAATIVEYEEALEGQSTQRSMEELIEKIDALQAWDFESEVQQILGKMGMHDLNAIVDNLSGGQRKRVALAKTLLAKPDLLVLDEPTNHLDLELIEWLERYLATSTMTLLLVTHDRYFMEQVTDEIIEIEDFSLQYYKGNYSYFLERKSEAAEQKATEVDKARKLMGKELEWLRRQPKARGTKAKYRIDAFDKIKDKATEKIDNSQLDIRVGTKRQGGKVLELKYITKSYGDLKITDNFTYIFNRGEKIGLIGANGAGKTTFLNIITGIDTEFQGEIDKGQTTTFGYFKQDKIDFSEDLRVIDVVKEIAEVIKLASGDTISAGQFLQHFLFTPEMQFSYVNKLSGGEKKRLQLLRVLIKNPNFLILDEPTNDFDIYTLNVLEEYLASFGGTLLVVTHDRYFMDRIIDHTFIFEGDGVINDFPGNYSQYREMEDLKKKEAQATATPKKASKPQSDKPKEKKKLSYNEAREFETLEKEIEQLEEKKEALEAQLNSGETDHVKLTEWAQELDALGETLDEKTMRWMELAEWA